MSHEIEKYSSQMFSGHYRIKLAIILVTKKI